MSITVENPRDLFVPDYTLMKNIFENFLSIVLSGNNYTAYCEIMKEFGNQNISKKKKFHSDYEESVKRISTKIYTENKFLPSELIQEQIDFLSKTSELLGYIKELSKRSFHQNQIKKFTQDILTGICVVDFIGAGNKALYCENGKIVSKEKKKKGNRTKSLDFKIIFNFKGKELVFYIIHKFTREDGGSQDNQKNDALNSASQFANVKDGDVIVCLCLDGNYYLKKRKNYDTYLDEIKDDFSESERIMVFNSFSIAVEILNYVKNWLLMNNNMNEVKTEIAQLNERIKEVEEITKNAGRFREVPSETYRKLIDDWYNRNKPVISKRMKRLGNLKVLKNTVSIEVDKELKSEDND